MKIIGPCTQHIVDAIRINQARKLVYSGWSDGKSLAISDELIAWEKKLYLGSVLGDLLTFSLRKKGISFFELEFVDMNTIPPLPEKIEASQAPVATDFLLLNIPDLIRELKAAQNLGYAELQAAAQKWIEKFEKEPRLNCIVRHFLESIRAFARNAPVHLRKVSGLRALYLKCLIDLTIKTQISDLRICNSLDEKALHLQTQGILILYWDIPHIP
jgi:hypothetical protein